MHVRMRVLFVDHKREPRCVNLSRTAHVLTAYVVQMVKSIKFALHLGQRHLIADWILMDSYQKTMHQAERYKSNDVNRNKILFVLSAESANLQTRLKCTV